MGAVLNQSQDSKHWKSNLRHCTSGAREGWSTPLLQGCHGWTSGKMSLCSPEWDPGRGLLVEFDFFCQPPALVGEGIGGGELGAAPILGGGRGTVREGLQTFLCKVGPLRLGAPRS